MISLTPTDIAYIAGFFDGEGSVAIRRSSSTNIPSGLIVSLFQNDPAVLKWIQSIFGGTISCSRDNHQWQISGDNAIGFLRVIYPYAIVKKNAIALGIEYLLNITYSRGKTLSKAENDFRWNVYNRLQESYT